MPSMRTPTSRGRARAWRKAWSYSRTSSIPTGSNGRTGISRGRESGRAGGGRRRQDLLCAQDQDGVVVAGDNYQTLASGGAQNADIADLAVDHEIAARHVDGGEATLPVSLEHQAVARVAATERWGHAVEIPAYNQVRFAVSVEVSRD